MSGVRTGSRLDQLLALRARLDNEIQIERARTRQPDHNGRTHTPTPLTNRQRLDQLDTTSKAVKLWAMKTGLIQAGPIPSGRAPRWLIEAYARAKGLDR